MKLAKSLLVGLLIAAVGCGAPPQQVDEKTPPDRSDPASLPRFQREPEEMSQALDQVTTLVDATTQSSARDAKVTPQGDNGSTKPCETDKDLVYASYAVEVHLDKGDADVFDSAVAFWKDNGYDVVVRDAGSQTPSAYLNFGDFAFQLYVNSLSNTAFIGGSTPCYPPSG